MNTCRKEKGKKQEEGKSLHLYTIQIFYQITNICTKRKGKNEKESNCVARLCVHVTVSIGLGGWIVPLW